MACRSSSSGMRSMRKRRHGMGFLGLGSTITLLGMKYGSSESVKFTEDVSREMAVAGWEAALELAREKGPAPIMNEEFTVTKEMLRKRPEMARDGWKPGAKIPGRLLHARYSRYMQRIAEVGAAAGRTSWRRSARASRITARSRRPGRSRCRWRTMPATASSRRSRITISAT